MTAGGLFPEQQTEIGFAAPLTEKYRPRTMAEFVGLDQPRAGTGKTTLAIAFAAEIKAQLHHIPIAQVRSRNSRAACALLLVLSGSRL